MAGPSKLAMQLVADDSDDDSSSYSTSDSENASGGSSSEYEESLPGKTRQVDVDNDFGNNGEDDDDDLIEHGQETIDGQFEKLFHALDPVDAITDTNALDQVW
ncbi:hypothetical protein EXIGLDRAFT_649499, partial [Exidia glandulosa HHB12029]